MGKKKDQTSTSPAGDQPTTATTAPATEPGSTATTPTAPTSTATEETPETTTAKPAKAKLESGFRVKHGRVLVGPRDERKTGASIGKGEVSDADRDRLIADGTIEPRS